FITLLEPYTGQTLSEARVPALAYGTIMRVLSDSLGKAHVSGSLGGKEYIAQFDPALAMFSRFAVVDDCPSSGARGPAIGLGGELWVVTFKADADYSITENFLR